MGFVHLHLHSQYSLLDGAITVDGLVSEVKKLGMSSVALTDHGNMFGALDFYRKAKAEGIKPILGCEIYITTGSRTSRSFNKGESTHHLVLLAKNNKGLKNLYKLITIAYFEGFYYKPRIDYEVLRRYSEGLIGMSACLKGEVASAILKGEIERAKEKVALYRSFFEEGDYYLELMNHNIAEQRTVNDQVIEIAKEMSLPLVGTNDSHYLNADQAKAHEVLLCIQTGKTLNDPNHMRYKTEEFYLKSPKQMAEIFVDTPEACSNTLEIAAKCNVEIELDKPKFPTYKTPDGKDLHEYLEYLTRKGLEERLPFILKRSPEDEREKIRKRYKLRLESELSIIRSMGFSGYFLIVCDFVNYAKKKKIPVGPGRGSAAGSLVAYALRITDIDPIPYGLLFERFLNPERVSLPDIDVDFCIEGRDEVIKYVSKKYGKGGSLEIKEGEGTESIFDTRVAQIITFGKMQAKAAIRDVGRSMDMAYGEVDKIAKLVPNILNITLANAFKEEPRFEALRRKDSKVDELLKVAQALEGLNRHASIHAAGVVISDDKPLVEHLPMFKGQKDEIVTQFDMKAVEKIGLIKFDFLGLKTLTVIKNALKLIKEDTGKTIDMVNLPLDDKAVYRLLSDGDTRGIFQLESSGMRDLIVRLKPETFEDIIALVALYRPGPLGSGMVDDFIARKHGRTQIEYELPELKEILEPTYGVIVYQEQVMQIASLLANFSLGDADILRRAMGKKIPAVMEKQKEKFMRGAKEKNVNTKKAEKIFDLMAKFAGYGFNKSHSAAYANIAYQTAYLKAHHPVEFMAAMLTSEVSNQDKIIALIYDLKKLGIELLPPDVNSSFVQFTVEDNKVRFGLAAVKNVGENAIKAIIEARQEESFSDIYDFCSRVDLKRVNRRVVESLVKSGAFDSTGEERSVSLAAIEKAIEIGQSRQRDRESGQFNMFDAIPETKSIKPKYPEVDPWEDSQRLTNEKESLGFYLSGHPLQKIEVDLMELTKWDTESVKEAHDGAQAAMAGVVATKKEITTKRGDRMAFVTLEDLRGSIEMIVFSDVYKKSVELLNGEDPIFVEGKVDAGEDQVKLIVSDIKTMEQAKQSKQKAVHITLRSEIVSDKKLSSLKRAIKRHSGPLRSFLHIVDEKKKSTTIMLPDDLFLNPTDSFIKEVEKLFEKDVCEIR